MSSYRLPSYEDLNSQYPDESAAVREEVLQNFKEEMLIAFSQQGIMLGQYAQALPNLTDEEIRTVIPEELAHLSAGEYCSLIRWLAGDKKEESTVISLPMPYQDTQNECFRYAKAVGMLDSLDRGQMTLEIMVRVELIYYLMEVKKKQVDNL